MPPLQLHWDQDHMQFESSDGQGLSLLQHLENSLQSDHWKLGDPASKTFYLCKQRELFYSFWKKMRVIIHLTSCYCLPIVDFR